MFEESINDYRKVLKIEPDNLQAKNNLTNLFSILNGNLEFTKKSS